MYIPIHYMVGYAFVLVFLHEFDPIISSILSQATYLFKFSTSDLHLGKPHPSGL